MKLISSPSIFQPSLLQCRPGVARIEAKAWSVIETCRTTLGLASVPLPIPIERWIEHPLGFTFGIEDLSHLGIGVLGAARVQDRQITISDAITHEGRLRFTCAHELGHMVLHAQAAKKIMHAAVANNSAAPDSADRRAKRIEWEADRFAAAFLMPAPLVVRELLMIARNIARTRGSFTTPATVLAELMLDTVQARELWRCEVLSQLTEVFAVSMSALIHRFQDLTLADGKPFMAPSVSSDLLWRTSSKHSSRKV